MFLNKFSWLNSLENWSTYLCDVVHSDRQEVHFVSQASRCLNCCDVRVDEQGLHLLFLQRFDGLQ